MPTRGPKWPSLEASPAENPPFGSHPRRDPSSLRYFSRKAMKRAAALSIKRTSREKLFFSTSPKGKNNLFHGDVSLYLRKGGGWQKGGWPPSNVSPVFFFCRVWRKLPADENGLIRGRHRNEICRQNDVDAFDIMSLNVWSTRAHLTNLALNIRSFAENIALRPNIARACSVWKRSEFAINTRLIGRENRVENFPPGKKVSNLNSAYAGITIWLIGPIR